MDASVEKPVLNRQSLFDRLGGDRELAVEIVELFLSDYDQMLGDVVRAVSDRDPQRIERTAHALKGALLNISAESATGIAQQLEHLGRAGGTSPSSGGLLRDLEREMARLKVELDEMLSL